MRLSMYEGCVFLALASVLVFDILRRRRNERIERSRSERNRQFQQGHELRLQNAYDSFLQGVQAVHLCVHTAARQLPLENDTRTRLEEILEQSDKVLLQGREIMKDLQPVCAEGLSEALRRLTRDLESLHTCTYTIMIDGSPRPLLPMACEELFTIAREALWNSFRHAQAVHVYVSLNYSRDSLSLTVEDDGIGLDLDILLRGKRQGHWGLPAMKEGAQRLGAVINMSLGSLQGTKVEVKVPAKSAYV